VAKSGDFVAALLDDGEATVKKLKLAEDEPWLMPLQRRLPAPSLLGDEGRIPGKVVAVLRSL
jgi:repressor LexA